jgi:hypothetical protein
LQGEEVQWRRLHKESQPWEQLDMIIEEIRRLMIRSAEAVSKGKLSRGEPAIAAGQQQQHQEAMEQMDNSKELFGIQVDFNSGAGKLMSRSS